MQKSKYLVATDRDSLWGTTVTTVGYEEIAPYDEYPTKGHADGYYFDLQRGRILNEYQVLYVVEGEGKFTSQHGGTHTVTAGTVFMLFPGEWHTYAPNTASGWKCHWIGFNGIDPDRRMKAGFMSMEHPVYGIGYSSGIVNLFDSAMNAAIEERPFSQQMLAAIAEMILATAITTIRAQILTKDKLHSEMVAKARTIIRQNLETGMTIQQVAELVGMGYSNFRRLFRTHAGCSPAHHQQQLRLQRAKELLSATNESIKEIAFKLAFDSADYFSAKFRRNTGLTPSQYREMNTGIATPEK